MKYEYERNDLEDYLDDYYFDEESFDVGDGFGLTPIEEEYGIGSALHSIVKEGSKYIVSIEVESRDKENYIKDYAVQSGDELEFNLLLSGVTCFMPPESNPCLVKITDISENSITTQIVGLEKEWVKSVNKTIYTESYLFQCFIDYVKAAIEKDTEKFEESLKFIEKAIRKNPALLPIFENIRKEFFSGLYDDGKLGISLSGKIPSKEDYLIMKASYSNLGTGSMCGPVMAYVKYFDGNDNWWLYCCDSDNFLTFNLSREDITDYMTGNSDDCYDENGDYNSDLYNKTLCNFIGDIKIDQSMEYYRLGKELKKSEDTNSIRLINYIVDVVSMGYKETDKLISESIGKLLSEINIPVNERLI